MDVGQSRQVREAVSGSRSAAPAVGTGRSGTAPVLVGAVSVDGLGGGVLAVSVFGIAGGYALSGRVTV